MSALDVNYTDARWQEGGLAFFFIKMRRSKKIIKSQPLLHRSHHLPSVWDARSKMYITDESRFATLHFTRQSKRSINLWDSFGRRNFISSTRSRRQCTHRELYRRWRCISIIPWWMTNTRLKTIGQLYDLRGLFTHNQWIHHFNHVSLIYLLMIPSLKNVPLLFVSYKGPIQIIDFLRPSNDSCLKRFSNR